MKPIALNIYMELEGVENADACKIAGGIAGMAAHAVQSVTENYINAASITTLRLTVAELEEKEESTAHETL